LERRAFLMLGNCVAMVGCIKVRCIAGVINGVGSHSQKISKKISILEA